MTCTAYVSYINPTTIQRPLKFIDTLNLLVKFENTINVHYNNSAIQQMFVFDKYVCKEYTPSIMRDHKSHLHVESCSWLSLDISSLEISLMSPEFE